MIRFNKNIRSTQTEIMDSADFRGKEMQQLLKDLKMINKWLGGNKITINGLQKLLAKHPKSKEITILDIGCGDGAMLRKCSSFLQKNGYQVKCIGIDFNTNILEYAELQTNGYMNIEYKKVDVFLEESLIPNCDIALFTLFLHHFDNQKIEYLIKSVLSKISKGLIINDLERSKHAFILFKLVSKLFLNTKTARHDGLVSIARGFRKQELEVISTKIHNHKSTISWQWAYRYQWILEKTG